MYWGGKYYHCKVLLTEEDEGDNDGESSGREDNIPLNVFRSKDKKYKEREGFEKRNGEETNTENDNSLHKTLDVSVKHDNESLTSSVVKEIKNNELNLNIRTASFNNDNDDDGDENLSLISVQNLKVPLKDSDKSTANNEDKGKEKCCSDSDDQFSKSAVDNSDADLTCIQACEVTGCKSDVFSSCHICNSLLCHYHFINMGPCNSDHRIHVTELLNKKRKLASMPQQQKVCPKVTIMPEDFPLKISPSEDGSLSCKVKIVNKQKEAHNKRVKGDEYVSPKSGKTVPARALVKSRCSGVSCSKLGKACSIFSDEERLEINKDFYGSKSLQSQREYIIQHVKVEEVKTRTVKNRDSRRAASYYYSLSKSDQTFPVCKIMFLNTLNISEKTLRTALKKRLATGTVEKEKRGGRHDHLQEEDRMRREAIKEHISRFSRIESHYCRSESSQDYLHSDLSMKKMYEMFMTEYSPRGISASYTTYCDVLKSQNIFFHNPKKDPCKICENFRNWEKGNSERNKELFSIYEEHNKEKEAIRRKKDQAKHKTESNVQVPLFDLQHIIYLQNK